MYARGTKPHRHIEADQAGPNEVLYRPGPQSMDFMWTQVTTMGSGSKGGKPVPWVAKLALIANDAINNYSKELGVDGYFYVSMACSSVFAKSGAADASLDGFPHARRFELGPSLFFANYRRGRRERVAWKEANVQEKLQLQSLCWKAQSLTDSHPVLPIWADDSTLPKGAERVPNQKYFTRATAFPSPKLLKDAGLEDTTIDKIRNRVLGASCLLLESKLWLGPAQRQKESSGQSDKLHRALSLRFDHEDTDLLNRIRHNSVPGDDQIAGLIKAASRMRTEFIADLIPYGEAHAWAPVVSKPSFTVKFD